MEHELNIKEIHEATLEIVKKISDICDEINIDYFVMFGSLIGAIRHKGFIPWDDDFDVAMLRPDYERFVKYCEQNKKNLYPFRLLNRQNCENFPYTISRMNDFRYRAVYDNIIPYDSGLFVDIYPFDGYGLNPQYAIKKLSRRKNYLVHFTNWAIREKYRKPKHGGVLYSLGKRVCFIVAHIIGQNWFLDQYDRLREFFPFNDSKYVGNVCWDKVVLPYDKSIFEDYLIIPFEDIQVKIPIGYDKLLRQSYGDYMKLPPESERIASHDYKLYRR